MAQLSELHRIPKGKKTRPYITFNIRTEFSTKKVVFLGAKSWWNKT